MSYDDIAAVFMTDALAAQPEPVVPETAARRLRDAIEPIATQGWWSRSSADAIGPLGLDFFTAYVWGRSASLGQPAPAVVAATFGVFPEPVIGMVAAAGAANVDRDTVLAARERGATEAVAAVADDHEADAIATPLLAALDTLDPLGRTLFAALRALPRPASAPGRLWRAAELVREHRGDSHLAAVVVAGLDAAEANVLTELWLGYPVGEYTATRALGPDAIAAAADRLATRGWVVDGALTAAGRAARERIEADTDRGQQRLIDALGDDLETVIAGAAEISARLVAARSVPTDARKRAAG